ncbi:GAF sensor signal transduction histidine kinase [[Leptolyngbya] sp. PCC 7376]|uniref:GAF domain-containing sensor histidine kinase n=1 Tax=[Leptolyngbya] sp. PCC 7376 TaxID=111781 RepID=UPI00029EF1E5|nr:ATP-binding protein [[Leptolyngbya] sp. PCC 7376]AFY37766.1 GAF sensor signal transduction histidine kinase [[Leptolyngbya] sp. PCC 7376]
MTTFPQLLPVGAEFTALCQQQLRLLALSLGADWSVLYLAQPNHSDQEIELQVVSSYPERLLTADRETVVVETAEIETLIDQTLMVGELEPDGEEFAQETAGDIAESSTAFPLFHEDLILGILATGRTDRGWRSPEISQIELVTQSLSWACVLDQQKSWATQQLAQQRQLQEVEQEHFHDLLHQLRNPTMAIGTFGKLLLKRLEMEDRNYPAAVGVVRESDRLKEMLHQFGQEVNLLDAQIQMLPPASTLALPPDALTGSNRDDTLNLSQSIALTAVNLIALIEPIVESMAAIATEKEITLRTKINSDLPEVWGNAQALTEIICNLLENAIKYTPEQGHILLHLAKMGEAVQLAVHDTGYGMPAADLDHVFERHYRGAQAEGEIPGTGLGLAIAHELVEKMDGDLEVDSPCVGLPTTKKCPGSTFTLWLRIAH